MIAKKVLVTGGAGFIGYHLCTKLARLGTEVKVYGKLLGPRDEVRLKRLRKIGVKSIVGDILEAGKLSEAVKDVDLICHLAARSSVRESRERPVEYFQTNVVGTLNVLEAARKADTIVIFASSSTVYGKPAKFPTPEDSPLQPISYYGLSKLLGERCCSAYYESYGLPFACLRFFNVYGPEGGGVVYDFLRKIQANNNRLEIIGSGRQSKDFVYVDDVIESIVAVASSYTARGKTYNVGSGESTDVTSLANLIIRLLSLKEKTRIYCGLQRNWLGDVPYTQSDITKIKKELGWRPKVSLREGVSRTISWYEKEFGPIKR